MGDINFLSGQRGDKKEKKKEPLKKIEWTSPEMKAETENKKEGDSPLFSLFKKGNDADDKIKQSREAVLKTIGEKEKVERFDPIPKPRDAKEVKKQEKVADEKEKIEKSKALEPKKVEMKKMEVPKPVRNKAENPEPAAEEKNIDPRRINFLNRLIDSWINHIKDRQEKKKHIGLIPDLQKKEEKEPLKEAGKIDAKEAKPKDEKDNKKPVPESKALISSRVLETNLVKGENVLHFIDWQKNSFTLTLFCFFAVLVVSGAYVWLVLWEKEIDMRIANTEMNVMELSGKIEQAKKDVQEFSALEKKVKLLGQLLEDHIYWTNFFKFLEDNTLTEVFYSGGFSGDNSGNYTFAANAKNFNGISEQLKVFKRNDYVRSVNVKGGKLSSGAEKSAGVNFDLQISVDPKLFTNLK